MRCSAGICSLSLSDADIERVKRDFLPFTVPVSDHVHLSQREGVFEYLTGEVRPVNLLAAPFNWPQPVRMILDDADEFMDRRMGVWRRDQW